MKTFYKDGHLHREDGPAIIWHDGEEHWFNKGLRHRANGPAIVRKDGTTEYYFQGQLVLSEQLPLLHKQSVIGNIWKAYREGNILFSQYQMLSYAWYYNVKLDTILVDLKLYIEGTKINRERKEAYAAVRKFKLSTRPRFRI